LESGRSLFFLFFVLCDLNNFQTKGREVRIIHGTPEFVSPEVVKNDPVSLATDLWSLGVLTFVLLSKLSPFLGATSKVMMHRYLMIRLKILKNLDCFSRKPMKTFAKVSIHLLRNLLNWSVEKQRILFQDFWS